MAEAPVYDPTTGVPVFTVIAGTESPAESADDCNCCGNKQTVRPPLCTDHATCNDFCTGFAAFDRSECCDCPCPDRKTFPKCYLISGSISLAGTWDSGGSHYVITPARISFATRNHACGGVSQATFHVQEFIDDVLHGESDFVAQMDASAEAVTDCFPTNDKGKIHASIGVSVVSGTGTAALPGSSLLGTASQRVGDACKGGTGTIFANSLSIAGFGSFSVTPSCDDCPDSPASCGILDGDEPGVCGDSITIEFEHDTGTVDGGGSEIWEFISGTLTQSSKCAWGAGIGDASASIATTNGDGSCCPDCKCNECGVGCDTCHTCWVLQLSAGVDSETIDIGGGSCPAANAYSGIKFRNIFLGSPTGCPPP